MCEVEMAKRETEIVLLLLLLLLLIDAFVAAARVVHRHLALSLYAIQATWMLPWKRSSSSMS